MVYIGWSFSLLCSVVLPVLLSVFFAKKSGSAKGVLLGMGCFTATQILLRIPLLSVLNLWADYLVFQSVYPVAYLVLLSLSAGIFEEIGRYIFIKLFMKKRKCADAFAFGAGHGGIEAVLLVGISQFLLIFLTGGDFTGYSAMGFFLSGVERVFAICAHIGLSIVIWYGVNCRKSGFFVPFCIILHGFFDFLAVYLQYLGVSVYVIEAVLALLGIILLLMGIFLCRALKKSYMEEK